MKKHEIKIIKPTATATNSVYLFRSVQYTHKFHEPILVLFILHIKVTFLKKLKLLLITLSGQHLDSFICVF